MSVSSFAVRLFGRFTKGKRYDSLQESLRKARKPVSADVYAATSMLYSVLMIVPGFLLGFLIARVFHLGFPLMSMLIALFSATFVAMAYWLILSYPSMIAGERKRKIDAALPYTAGFMHALSRSGATVADIFRELSTRGDVGELATEARAFMRDIEYLGQDPLTALRNLARTTPSEKFKTFLEVLISIIETGGEITPYFSTKVSEFQTTLKEENKKTITSLEFMAEIYVILIVFLPLLFLAIMLFMGFLPGQTMNVGILYVIAYGWIPMGTIAFAVLTSTKSPVQVKGRGRAPMPPSPYKTVPLVAGDARDRALLQRLRGARWRVGLKRFLSNPLKAFTQNPSYVLLFSAPTAVFYLMFSPAIETSTLFFTFSIAAIPYVVAYEFRSKRVQQINEALPDFLKSLSSASRSGLTLPRAIAVTSTASLGPLTDEVRRARKDIEWGSSATEALAQMERRVGASDLAARTTTLVRKASEAEENISDVVDIALNDVEIQRTLTKERNAAMFVYKLVIFMTFAVSFVTVYFMVDAYIALPIGGIAAGEVTITGIDPMTVKMLFYHVVLLMGISGGLLAAQMGGGDLKAGIKYSIVMGLVAVLIFELALLPKQPSLIKPAEESVAMLLFAGA